MAKVGDALGGAAKGAATGAALGTTVFPGIGTAIGAIGGGIAGLVGGLTGGDDGNKNAPQVQLAPGQAAAAYQQQQVAQQQQQDFINASAAQNGLGNQSSVYNALGNVANGTGPNPAQAMLNQATGANTANQAALMAGQRGASANPALIARMASMQGAANQQQAIGQGATLQANQSLNALGQQGQLATNMVQNQAGAVANANNFANQNQGQVFNAQAGLNANATSSQNNVNSNNTTLQAGANQNAYSTDKGLLAGAGTALTALTGAGGPKASSSDNANYDFMKSGQKYAEGGEVQSGPMSAIGKRLKGINTSPAFAKGGVVDAKVSPGERYLPPAEVAKVAQGKAAPMKAGEKIKGKATVKGDSLKNDTVSKKLEAGGIVIPRSITQSKNAEADAHAFISAVLAHQGKMK